MSGLPYLAAFAFGLAGTLLLTPAVRRLAVRAGAIDRPGPRKVHRQPVPLWGGVALYLALVAGVGLTLWWFAAFRAVAVTPGLASNLWGMLAGGTLILLLGMADDRYGIPARTKLAGQIAAALVMLGFGIRIDYLSNPFNGMLILPPWLGASLTLAWIVGITNAMNLLDGLDGLLAGVSLITATVFLVVSLLNGQFLAALVMAGLAGCTLGFLRYNFNPAQVFMGDTGSLFLGLMFAGWSVIGLLKSTAALTLLIPVCILGLPILDTATTILRRGLSGRPLFQPDREHLHHRLLARGMSPRRAVALLYAVSILFGLAGLFLACAVH